MFYNDGLPYGLGLRKSANALPTQDTQPTQPTLGQDVRTWARRGAVVGGVGGALTGGMYAGNFLRGTKSADLTKSLTSEIGNKPGVFNSLKRFAARNPKTAIIGGAAAAMGLTGAATGAIGGGIGGGIKHAVS